MLHEQQRAKAPSHEIKIIVIFLKGIIAIARSIYVFLFLFLLPGKGRKRERKQCEIER